MVETKIIKETYILLFQNKGQHKHDHIYNDNVLGYYRKPPKTRGPVLIIKTQYRLKNFSISFNSTSIITGFPLAVYKGLSHFTI